MINRLACGALVAASMLFAANAPAEDVRTVAWDDLTARLSAADNPFATLTPDQLMALSDIAALRDRKARGSTLSAEELAMERTAMARLSRDRIDPDALLASRDEIGRKKRAAATRPNAALDGQLVRIAGYVLPLEYSGKKVTQFLLVPWVGACIHTPPPEPNQIVYVKPDQAFDIDSAFEAVWITGRLSTRASTQSVRIVDGSADVDVGYALKATKVDRYRQ